MDEPKKDGAGGFGGREERTPAIVVPTGVEDILKRIANVRLRIRESRGTHDRTDQLLEDLERLVRRGGSDDQLRTIYARLGAHCADLSEHMRDEMSVILANLGHAFDRLSQG